MFFIVLRHQFYREKRKERQQLMGTQVDTHFRYHFQKKLMTTHLYTALLPLLTNGIIWKFFCIEKSKERFVIKLFVDSPARSRLREKFQVTTSVPADLWKSREEDKIPFQAIYFTLGSERSTKKMWPKSESAVGDLLNDKCLLVKCGTHHSLSWTISWVYLWTSLDACKFLFENSS